MYQHFKLLYVHCEYTFRHWEGRTVFQRHASLLRCCSRAWHWFMLAAGRLLPSLQAPSVLSSCLPPAMLCVEFWEIKTRTRWSFHPRVTFLLTFLLFIYNIYILVYPFFFQSAVKPKSLIIPVWNDNISQLNALNVQWPKVLMKWKV